LKVATGNLRGAGTQSRAWVQLVGEGGSTERYTIGDDEESGTFDRASVRAFTIPVPKHIGQLRQIVVEKGRDHERAGEGWYLQHIEVVDPRGEKTIFPCNAWLGESDCGGFTGPYSRQLAPMTAAQVAARDAPMPVSVRASGMSIPHPEKVRKQGAKGHNTRGFGSGGEDAYFYCQPSETTFAMGVADGVYMWRSVGIDSGAMSRALMQHARAAVEGGQMGAREVLGAAVGAIKESGVLGSSTVCLLTVDTGTGLLRAANLGDSGFLVYGRQPNHPAATDRNKYTLKYRTSQLEHSFGCPYQIGHHAQGNKVEDADVAQFHVRVGDIIVMGSDGLLDNVSDLDIAHELTQGVAQGVSVPQLVQRLVRHAFEASMDKHRMTPYSKGATEAFDMVYSGGKPDDITVLVAQVR